MFKNQEMRILLKTNNKGIFFLINKIQGFHKIIFIKMVFNKINKEFSLKFKLKEDFQMKNKFLIGQMSATINVFKIVTNHM